MRRRSLVALAAAALAAACADAVPTAPKIPLSRNVMAAAGLKQYILIGRGDTLPAGLAARVSAAGGSLTASYPQVGMAVATAASTVFAANGARIAGMDAVVPDPVVQWLPPAERRFTLAANTALPPAVIQEPLQFLQWNLQAVHAQDAWSAGYFGQGANVYILDTGIQCAHPDLASNVDVVHSVSFIPGEPVCVPLGTTSFGHGTYVAGIIGAAANHFGIVGVAPLTRMVGVKVLSEDGSGPFSAILAGILYATDDGAEIINMSLGTPPLPRSGFVDSLGNVITARDMSQLVTLVDRVTTYAYQHGSTIIAAAGNDAVNRNADQDAVVIPADAPNVLSIAATGPVGWGIDQSTNLDVPAEYTNFGLSRIDFADPGGNDVLFLQNPAAQCFVGIMAPCWVFDLILSTINGGYGFGAGTSGAAPHASAIAALIDSRFGRLKPAQLTDQLRNAAVPLGKPGKDPWFGLGFLDAGRAVR